jgi:hypothetical protein
MDADYLTLTFKLDRCAAVGSWNKVITFYIESPQNHSEVTRDFEN